MDIVAQRKKAEDFLALHRAPGIQALCNTSDVAGARIVVKAGFPAVASSSGGVAWMLGYPDGEIIPRDEMLDAVRRIADAVDVPVTADMEAGYGHAPEMVAETVRLTIEAGAVGLNIEDSDAQAKGHPLLDFDLSVERITAARAAARRAAGNGREHRRRSGQRRCAGRPVAAGRSVRGGTVGPGGAGADNRNAARRDDDAERSLVREPTKCHRRRSFPKMKAEHCRGG